MGHPNQVHVIQASRDLLSQGKFCEAEHRLAEALAVGLDDAQTRQAAVELRSRCLALHGSRLTMPRDSHPARVAAELRARAAIPSGSVIPVRKLRGLGPVTSSRCGSGAGAGGSPEENEANAQQQLEEDKGCLIDAKETPQLQHWDICMLVCIAYVAVATPWEVAFLEPEINALFVVNRLCDVIFLIDMFLQFFITVQDKKGNWIKDHGLLIKNYMRTWFLIDFVSILPFDMIGLIVSADAVSQFKAVRAVRILRLLKLLRMLRGSRIIKRWENHYSINYAIMGLASYMVFIVLCTHWFACAYHLVAYIQGIGTDTWIDQQDVEVETDWQVYILSVSWAAQTISSIGYGDALATTTTERICVIVLMFIGSTIFAFALGEISYAVQQCGQKEERYHSIIDDINSFTDEIDLPLDLRSRCRLFIKHKHKTNTLHSIQDALSQLSQALREEVAMHTHSSWVQSVDFFKGCPSGFVVSVASLMTVRTYTPNEKIYQAGEGVSNMFVVHHGMVAKSGSILGPGKLLGVEMTHMMLYQPVAYSESARALTFADMYILSWKDFRNCLSDYPLVFPQVKKIAAKAIFRKHILAFSAACRNYAADNLGRSRDNYVKMLEEELLRKRRDRVRGLKGSKEEEDHSSIKIRPEVVQQIEKARMQISLLNKKVKALEESRKPGQEETAG